MVYSYFYIPTATTSEEIAFKEAYFKERSRQELTGVVCIYPSDIKVWLPDLSDDQFESILQHMHEKGFIWIAKGSIPGQSRIICWNA
jgi:hypothetical protein